MTLNNSFRAVLYCLTGMLLTLCVAHAQNVSSKNQATTASTQPTVSAAFVAPSAGILQGRRGPEPQPEMQAALRGLKEVEADLQKGAHDKGGHRLKALRLVRQAEAEVQAAIQYANVH